MELLLTRSYLPKGTNGVLTTGDGHIICYTIELPWRQNLRNRSCIPEGRYRIILRRSARLNGHLLLMQVPNRDLILVHPANNAATQLRGCIAPVSSLTGEGQGDYSRAAFEKLMQLVTPEIKKGEAVWINVTNVNCSFTIRD